MTKGRKEIMFGGEEQTHVLIGRAPPDRKDWREEDSIVMPVKNQGGCAHGGGPGSPGCARSDEVQGLILAGIDPVAAGSHIENPPTC